MEHNPVKQRIVGAVILLSVAVIILPMFFGDGSRQGGDESVIPPRSPRSTETAIIPLQVHPVVRESGQDERPVVVEQAVPGEAAPVVADVAASEAPEPESAAVPSQQAAPAPGASSAQIPSSVPASPPAGTSDDMPKAGGVVRTVPDVKPGSSPSAVPAWVVQVGSFSSDENALALRDRLRARKIPAFVEKVESGGAPVYRVRVGPEADRARADGLRQRLLDEFQLQGMVMQHR